MPAALVGALFAVTLLLAVSAQVFLQTEPGRARALRWLESAIDPMLTGSTSIAGQPSARRPGS